MAQWWRAEELTWQQFGDRVARDVVYLPVGALEQHGPHLPLGTDSYQVVAAVEAVAARTGGVVMPALRYGYKSHPRSGGGEAFPGTTSLEGATVVAAVRDILLQLAGDGARRVAVASGHYENRMFVHEGIDAALDRLGGTVRVLSALWLDFLTSETLTRVYPGEFPGIELEHAAVLETSVMLHLHPELVHADAAPDSLAEFGPYDVYPEAAMGVPATGSLAPAVGASAEIGRTVFDECVAGLAAAVGHALR